MRKSWPISIEMPNLLELQLQLRRAVLGGDTAGLVAAIRGDGLDPAARLRIYRNHAFATLGAVLEGTFPVVCRLVDKRFFAYAAHEYLREHPPHSRCLVEYGADFADFLAGFEPCKDLPYLADVARFEWALNIAATVREASPLKIEALAGIPPESAALLKISLQPSVSYFASGWPIDAIWLANQQNEVRRWISRAAVPPSRSGAPTRASAGNGSTPECSRSAGRWPKASRSARRRQPRRRTPHSISPQRSIASSPRGLSSA